MGGNAGWGGDGGGIFNLGTLIMNNCSIVGNQTGAPGSAGAGSSYGAAGNNGAGAGISTFGVASLTNCTVAGNTSGGNAGAGIYNQGTLTVVACTFTANQAASAAGIYNYLGTVSLRNTIVADNWFGPYPPATDLYGTFVSVGHNLVSRTDGSSGINGTGDITGTIASPQTANLSQLNTYHGPTPICPPAGQFSAAVDAGDDALMNPPINLLLDQTGRFRQYGYHVDIGAAEYIYLCSIQNASASSLGSTNAIILVNLDSGGTLSSAYVQYGPTISYGSTIVSNQALGLVGMRAVYFSMNNLLPGTLYHYRVVMTNYTDTFTLPDQTLTTLFTNASLAHLTLSSGTLAPAFKTPILSYSATADPGVSTINVTAIVAQPNAVLRDRINGGSYTVIPSGSSGDALPLRVGTNSVDVLVTAQDQTITETYNIALTWNPPIPPPNLTSPGIVGGAFQFSFTNLPGAPFTVWASDDLLLPLTNWFSLGPATDSPAGFFQFSDPGATNSAQRFYQLRSP